MPPVGGLAVQRAQHIARPLQGIDGLEQRRDIEGRFAAAFVGDVGPSGQQQHRQYVFRPLRAAHDVFADGAAAEFVARLRDGFEHPQAAPAHGIEAPRWDPDRAPADRAIGAAAPRGASAGQSATPKPCAITSIMHVRMLSDVERRQMKTEGAHPAHEPAHQEISGVASPILEQAVGGEPDIGQQFVGILIGVGPAFVGRLEPLADLAEEHAVRHAVVARRRQRLGARQYRAVGIDARGQRGAHADAVRALAQGLGELAAFGEIRRNDQLLMPMQGLANGLAVHVRIAVHVAADPGTEMQDARHVQLFHRHGDRPCASAASISS